MNRKKRIFQIVTRLIFLSIIIISIAGCIIASKISDKNLPEATPADATWGAHISIPLPDFSITMTNAYIISDTDTALDIYYNDEEAVLPVSLSCVVLHLSDEADRETDYDESRNLSGTIADLTFTAEGISMIKISDNVVNGKVLNIYENSLNIKDVGEVAFGESFTIYNTYGNIHTESSPNVLLGYDNLKFVINDGELLGVVISTNYDMKNIRVLITTADGGHYHSYVEITSDTDFSVNYGDRILVYGADDIVTITSDMIKSSDGIITAASNVPEGKLKLTSTTRQNGAPEYRGTIEIGTSSQGMTVVNELSLEEYLYGVVSSEVPSTYEEAALCVQAICARGYAYKHLESCLYESLGAHLDDTTSCQVYNNIPETKQSIAAVKQTLGMVPVYDGNLIEAYYFSTSCGTTCTNSDVWAGSVRPYLNDSIESFDNPNALLSSEEDFRAFIDGETDGAAFERDLPYYRWSVSYTFDDMRAAIDSTLYNQMNKDLSNFYIMGEDGSYTECTTPLSTLGDITKITVTSRGNSGIVTEMVIEGTEHTIRFQGQSNMRSIMTPKEVIISKQDGSSQSGWSLLPSPFYYIIPTETGFVIRGGGFGHGVGMSQNGANIMAQQGYSYEEIIQHYYHGAEIVNIYTGDFN
jgi:stage II sporulation protein D